MLPDFLYKFITSPDDLLRQWGCLLSLPREITSLYKVREFGAEAANDFKTISTFGYPIYIYEGTVSA